MDFTIPLDTPFSLDYTLESGQLFRWDRRGERWYGVVSGTVLKAKQEGDVLRCSSGSDLVDSSYITRYFRLDEDLDHVLGSLAKDDPTSRAVQRFYGLRLVRQDPWECLASFVLATNANIPRIKGMVSSICARYGGTFQVEGESFSAFPSPEVLAGAETADLRDCGLGYRAPFLRRVAIAVAEGRVDFDAFHTLGYEESRKLLTAELFGEKVLLGVGPKVADCVLLYSLGKDEAFPIDVWILRVLMNSYPRLLGPALTRRLKGTKRTKLSVGDYENASRRARSYFGKYAGYAQLYLYAAAREEAV
jgi:N-glycosylase/DNA lyase